jgi:asparagine synthetase B (glutamine-hydrolysing)
LPAPSLACEVPEHLSGRDHGCVLHPEVAQRRVVQLLVERRDAVGHHHHLEPVVEALPHRVLHADLRDDPGDHHLRAAARRERVAEDGGVEGPVAVLVDDRLPRQRGELVDHRRPLELLGRSP